MVFLAYLTEPDACKSIQTFETAEKSRKYLEFQKEISASEKTGAQGLTSK